MPKESSLSKAIHITYGSTRGKSKAKKKVVTTNLSLEQITRERHAVTTDIGGKPAPLLFFHYLTNNLYLSTVLSFTQRQQILFADMQEHGHENAQDVPMEVDCDDDWEDEEKAGLLTFPPGEEGLLQSHAGGEAILHDIFDGMTNSCALPFISPALPC
jgi:hypothetical protein